ncbi:hypothetical protein EDB82DRAFT_488350 [Fusarium venenatum]|uniref:uncharacterized protein n=1 Tax=Fusarium venenatum TaxID=56646 RepID=UPI001D5C4183|nr:hypothetical protein EDB82DRAFT_488350 [Fusarium venenatum]
MQASKKPSVHVVCTCLSMTRCIFWLGSQTFLYFLVLWRLDANICMLSGTRTLTVDLSEWQLVGPVRYHNALHIDSEGCDTIHGTLYTM